jgi:hypothetical protein
MGSTTTYNAGPTREHIIGTYEGDPNGCESCGWHAKDHPRQSGREYDSIYGPRPDGEYPAPHDFAPRVQRYSVLDYSQVGWTVAYLAVETIATGAVWAGVTLLHRSRDGSITTKDMSEDMGPGEDRCPERILDRLTATDSEYANEWRARCRAYHAARRAKPKVRPGQRVTFAAPLVFSNGDEVATFEYVKGSTFRAGHTRYSIPSWRDRAYSLA